MAKIELNNYEIQISKSKDGNEVAQFVNSFNPEFIKTLREQGVQDKVIKVDE